MLARDVMSSPVITLRPGVPVHAAAALLVSHGFTGAPVVDDEHRVIGIATEADLVRGRIVPHGWIVDGQPALTVAEVMTLSPAVMPPDSDLADVVALMLDTGIRSVPIVDDGKLVGVVSRRDALRVAANGEATSDDVRRRRHPTGDDQ
ncbi:MAG TPA: CBS domain-containing protein [Pseudonocardia sp.]|nr:CBS domain-containing protein [Pseudonocardia sp.]